MSTYCKNILVFCLFLLTLLSFSSQKAYAVKTEKTAYTLGIIASAELFNLSSTIIESINLLNSQEFQKEYGLDKPVIFTQKMMPTFTLDSLSQHNIIEQALLLQNDPNIDLILVIGINASRFVLEHNQGIKPIFLISEHDYIENKLLPSYEDSGVDNLTAFIKKENLYFHFQYLSELMDLRKIGILVVDTQNSTSRLYAQRLKEMCANNDMFKNNELLNELTGELTIEEFIIKEDSIEAVEQILPDIITAKPHALIVTGIHSFETNEHAWRFFKPLIENDIPAISPSQESMAAKGALMSFAMNAIKKRDIIADTIAQILKGAKPRDLNMLHAYYPELNLNIAVANALELFLSYEILSTCQHFFYFIDTGE